VQLECLRSGIWGTASLWGRVMTYLERQVRKHREKLRETWKRP
jgi:hypothetical protein